MLPEARRSLLDAQREVHSLARRQREKISVFGLESGSSLCILKSANGILFQASDDASTTRTQRSTSAVAEPCSI